MYYGMKGWKHQIKPVELEYFRTFLLVQLAATRFVIRGGEGDVILYIRRGKETEQREYLCNTEQEEEEEE